MNQSVTILLTIQLEGFRMAWTEILAWAAGVIAAVVGTGFTLKLIISNKKIDKSQTIKVTQKNIQAGGDVVGGNKTTTINK